MRPVLQTKFRDLKDPEYLHCINCPGEGEMQVKSDMTVSRELKDEKGTGSEPRRFGPTRTLPSGDGLQRQFVRRVDEGVISVEGKSHCGECRKPLTKDVLVETSSGNKISHLKNETLNARFCIRGSSTTG